MIKFGFPLQDQQLENGLGEEERSRGEIKSKQKHNKKNKKRRNNHKKAHEGKTIHKVRFAKTLSLFIFPQNRHQRRYTLNSHYAF